MGRLLIIALFIGIVVAIVAVLLSFWNDIQAQGRRDTRRFVEPEKDSVMASNGVKKTAYVALIIVLFGVTSGWLGGL
jgi:H+/Cl- antiporter ClcA